MKMTIEQRKKLIYDLECPVCGEISSFYTNECDRTTYTAKFSRKCKKCKVWINISFTFETKEKLNKFYMNFLNTMLNMLKTS